MGRTPTRSFRTPTSFTVFAITHHGGHAGEDGSQLVLTHRIVSSVPSGATRSERRCMGTRNGLSSSLSRWIGASETVGGVASLINEVNVRHTLSATSTLLSTTNYLRPCIRHGSLEQNVQFASRNLSCRFVSHVVRLLSILHNMPPPSGVKPPQHRLRC